MKWIYEDEKKYDVQIERNILIHKCTYGRMNRIEILEKKNSPMRRWAREKNEMKVHLRLEKIQSFDV